MTTLSNLQAIARERDEAVTALKEARATLDKTLGTLEKAVATLDYTYALLMRSVETTQTLKGITLHIEKGHDEALAGWKDALDALDDAELEPTLDSLSGIFDDIAPRLFPWELAAFATLVTETVARLVPSSVATQGAGR